MIPCTDESEPMALALVFSDDVSGSRDGDLDRVLLPLLDVLRRLDSGVYLPLSKSERSLRVTLTFLRLLKKDSECVGRVTGLLMTVVEPVLEFILRRLSGELQQVGWFECADVVCEIGFIWGVFLRYVFLVVLPPPCSRRMWTGLGSTSLC